MTGAGRFSRRREGSWSTRTGPTVRTVGAPLTRGTAIGGRLGPMRQLASRACLAANTPTSSAPGCATTSASTLALSRRRPARLRRPGSGDAGPGCWPVPRRARAAGDLGLEQGVGDGVDQCGHGFLRWRPRSRQSVERRPRSSRHSRTRRRRTPQREIRYKRPDPRPGCTAHEIRTVRTLSPQPPTASRQPPAASPQPPRVAPRVAPSPALRERAGERVFPHPPPDRLGNTTDLFTREYAKLVSIDWIPGIACSSFRTKRS